jgi:predicted  nucleic acid-binding Zn-ribbon protein
LHMTATARKKTLQEEKELEKMREELATLKKRLVQRERALARLQGEVADFKKIYAESLAPRIKEFDTLKRRLSGVRVEDQMTDPAGTRSGERFSFNSDEEAEQDETGQVSDRTESGLVPNIKELYRKVAKSIHPDLSTDEEERKWRQKLMAEANNAYAREDGESLQAILRQWEISPESCKSRRISAELMHISHRIFSVREKLRALEDEIESLMNSDIYRLMTRIEEARYEGIDLLAEMESKIDEDIALARKELHETSGGNRWRNAHGNSSSIPVRTILFPVDLCIGMLFIRKSSSDSFLDWRHYCEAAGRVTIPTGKSLRLDVPEGFAGALSPLQMLHANDLQALFLHGTKDSELFNLRGLTGLTELYLSGRGVTDAGLANLRRLKALNRLYIYETLVTDTGVETLNELPGLRYLTLSGSRVTQTGLNKLGKALPACRIIMLQNRGKA